MSQQTKQPEIVEALEFEEDEIPLGQFLDEHPELEAKKADSIPIVSSPLDGEIRSLAEFLLKHHKHLKFEDAYNTTGRHKGRCLIINNRHFEKKDLRTRTGTNTDRDKLKKLFQNLGYDVIVENDCTADKISEVCSMFILDPAFEEHKSCVLCILSHGYKDHIYGTDGKTVKEKGIIDLFGYPQCKLQGKPKLVIIQACRAAVKKGLKGRLCFGNNVADTRGENSASGELNEMIQILRSANLADGCPTAAPDGTMDILIAHSTLPGELSWLNSEQGSWFIHALCMVFESRSATEHVTDMLRMVRTIVFKSFDGAQIPDPVDRLLKKMYFFPKQ